MPAQDGLGRRRAFGRGQVKAHEHFERLPIVVEAVENVVGGGGKREVQLAAALHLGQAQGPVGAHEKIGATARDSCNQRQECGSQKALSWRQDASHTYDGNC